jgi:hypothetical protein
MPLEFVYKKQKKKLEEMARGSLERCKWSIMGSSGGSSEKRIMAMLMRWKKRKIYS